jgi:hypothetical protein
VKALALAVLVLAAAVIAAGLVLIASQATP